MTRTVSPRPPWCSWPARTAASATLNDCAHPGGLLADLDQRIGHGVVYLQSRYDLEVEKDRLGDVLDGIRPLTAAS